MDAGWKYQTPRSVLVPYNANQKAFFPEMFLPALYGRLKEDDLLSVTFPGDSMDHLNKFVSYFTDVRHPLLIGNIVTDGVVGEQAGVGWICESAGSDGARKASFGFVFFRKFWGTVEARELSWFMLAWWFHELNIDILYGTGLLSNGLARNFAQNFGFTHLCTLPKFFYGKSELHDASLSCLERPTFDERFNQWYESIEPRTMTPEPITG